MNFSQEEIDREQNDFVFTPQMVQKLIAGLKATQAMFEVARTSKFALTDEFKESLNKSVVKLCLPERYKDVSADTLKEMIFQSYIEDASILMIKNVMNRNVCVNIRLSDEDLTGKLVEYWKSKGLGVEKEDLSEIVYRITW